MPSLSTNEVECMSIKEIERKILFCNKTKQDIKNAELKNFMSIMHLAISAGSNPSKKNNKIFYQQLDKIFNNNEPDKEESLDDIMNLVNVKK